MAAEPKQTLQKMLDLLGFQVTVEESHMEDGLLLDVKTDDSGRLIGRQGQTLSDLQYITNRLLFQQDPSAPKIMVDVSGYRAQAREALVKKAKEAAAESIMWYTRKAFEYVGSVLAWTEELGGGKALATYEYMKKMMGVDLNTISYDYMADGNMVLSGDPETCLRQARTYQQAGTEMLLCHMQTYKVTHQQVMDSIRLIGQHVIPYFK